MSHDRYFMDKIVDHLICVSMTNGNMWQIFLGIIQIIELYEDSQPKENFQKEEKVDY